jgi:hypothetical protein
MVSGPQVDINSVQDDKKREAPRDTLNDSTVTILSELVDDGAEEQEVDGRPKPRQSITAKPLNVGGMLTK